MSSIVGKVDVSERTPRHTPFAEPKPETRTEKATRLTRWMAPALAVFTALKLIGFLSFIFLLQHAEPYKKLTPRWGGGHNAFEVLASWDGYWYLQIAAHGYDPQILPRWPGSGSDMVAENSAVFFPLYPALIRLVHEVTFLPMGVSALVVAIAMSMVAALGIFVLANRIAGRRVALIAVAIFAVAPGSGAEWAVYSDSLFIAIAAWTCWAVLCHRWVTAGLLTFLSGLSRPSATALIGAVGLAAIFALYKRRDGIVRPLFAMLVAPLGLVGYIGWVGYKTGKPNGYFLIQDGAWQRYVDYGKSTVKNTYHALTNTGAPTVAHPIADIVSVFVLVMLPILIMLLLRQRQPMIMTVYTLASILLALTANQIYANVSRYLLPAFPLWIAAAWGMRRVTKPMLFTIFPVLAVASGWYAGYALFILGVP